LSVGEGRGYHRGTQGSWRWAEIGGGALVQLLTPAKGVYPHWSPSRLYHGLVVRYGSRFAAADPEDYMVSVA